MRLGADPELFLQTANGKLISVLGKLGGTKAAPLQIIDLPQGFTVQEDNVAVELGIPPAASAMEYITNLKTCMAKALSLLPGLEYSTSSAASFPLEELEHPLAWVFGCEPDFNAWTGEQNAKPTAEDICLRSAGGHVHVETNVDPRNLVQAMDRRLGIASVLMDKGELRKRLYGKAGACRFKSYGPEYRVLSNFWIFNEQLIDWVWRNTERALNNLDVASTCQHVEECINTNDVKLAAAICNEYHLEVI